jgi:hypothetical protein
MDLNKHVLNRSQQAFFELLRAGLWGEQMPVQEFKSLIEKNSVDWEKVYQLAQEQSVQGIVLQGIEAVHGSWFMIHGSPLVPKVLLLQWIGEVQLIEQRNKEMNAFVADLIEKLRKYDIYAILVKGQGIAQCYERPLWRASGDVDLLLSADNYNKAKKMLLPLAQNVESEFGTQKHLGMTINGMLIELHGTLHSRLSKKVDREIDNVQDECFLHGAVRSWWNEHTNVFLPAVNQDVIFIFTHILHHFFIEGVGLRQVCDWCRILWVYRSDIDVDLLEKRLFKMGLMSEWKSFASLAVVFLGMPAEAMPLYAVSEKWTIKASKIMRYVLESGNFGHNRGQNNSCIFIVRKLSSLWIHTKDCVKLFFIFPVDSIKVWWRLMVTGTIETIKGNG